MTDKNRHYIEFFFFFCTLSFFSRKSVTGVKRLGLKTIGLNVFTPLKRGSIVGSNRLESFPIVFLSSFFLSPLSNSAKRQRMSNAEPCDRRRPEKFPTSFKSFFFQIFVLDSLIHTPSPKQLTSYVTYNFCKLEVIHCAKGIVHTTTVKQNKCFIILSQ